MTRHRSLTRADVITLSRLLVSDAEQVCRHYLSNGHRRGRTWRVGDADNAPGQSLSVQLSGPYAGHWTDFATGEHGDLLDVIARTCRLPSFRDVLDEARRFLSLGQRDCDALSSVMELAPSRSPDAARRLFASAKPVRGTIAEAYMRRRGITQLRDVNALRFHSSCYYRAHEKAPRESWPALLAAVTDWNGNLTGVQRTWLARDGSGKAPLATSRRAMGQLRGHGVRFGRPTEVMGAGEGLETVLALRQVLPTMPMIAALSATHLADLILPASLRRLYVVRDNDRAGHRAAESLSTRANARGIEARVLVPNADDFDTDLCAMGPHALGGSLRAQLVPEDVERFLAVERSPDRRLHPRSAASGRSSPPAAPGLQCGDRARSG